MNPSACSLPNSRRTAPRRARDFLLFQNDIFVLWDCCAGFLLGYLTDVAYMRVVWRSGVTALPAPTMLHEMVLCGVIAALILREPELATDRRLLALPRLLARLCRRGALAAGALLAVGFATGALSDMARLWLTGWCACFVMWVLVSRLAFVGWARVLQAQGELREAVAVIGLDGEAGALAAQLRREAEIVAVVEAKADGAHACDLAGILELAREGAIDTVVLAAPAEPARLEPLLEILQPAPVQIALTADLPRLGRNAAELRRLAGVPMAILSNKPLKYGQLLFKVCFDRVTAIVLLVLLAPVLAAVAVLVALDSPGPVIFRQSRSGWGGRSFTIYKFRSMNVSAAARRQTERNDARLTRIGAKLRRMSLDELPQLWNVLIGEMSIIGPRPHADVLHVRERAGYALVAEYARRQRVKPGLTGWAQVNGLRGAASDPDHLRQRVEHDLFYIDNWSLLFDLQILARTPLALLSRKNAF